MKLLSQHIDLLTKDNNEGRTNESVKLCEEDCTVNNTLPTISNTKVMNEKSTGKLSSGKVGNANASNAHYPQVNQGNKQNTDEVNRSTMLNENKQKLWTDVVRKPKRVTVIGKNVEAKTIDILQGVPKTVTMHVYRLSPETKVDQLLDFLKPQYPEVTCECLQSKHPDLYSSFKVNIYESNVQSFMDPDKWPSNVRVRYFLQFRQRNQNQT